MKVCLTDRTAGGIVGRWLGVAVHWKGVMACTALYSTVYHREDVLSGNTLLHV